jgi:2-polyprenyl-3-methyl-5-hydroxy-6-metoxy-1,4-benzoquinol methylase
MKKVKKKFDHLLRKYYYRHFFGKEKPHSDLIARYIDKLENKGFYGDVPASKSTWNSQYIKGRWKYMDQLNELPRYSAIVGLIAYLKPNGKILDVGCGEGIIFKKIRPYGYKKYVGIDISDNAINKIGNKFYENTNFYNVDVESFTIEESFDVIIFNEVLYYLKEPLLTANRIFNLLNNDGIFIVSSYRKSVRAMAILRKLKSRHNLIVEVHTSCNSYSWTTSLFGRRQKTTGLPVDE